MNKLCISIYGIKNYTQNDVPVNVVEGYLFTVLYDPNLLVYNVFVKYLKIIFNFFCDFFFVKLIFFYGYRCDK